MADLRSIIQEACSQTTCKVSFHNCTPYNVTPYWIDFNGRSVKYQSLTSGSTLNMDTYVSHLWFFKAKKTENDISDNLQQNKSIKVIAIPEEGIRNNSFEFINTSLNDSSLSMLQKTSNNSDRVLICALCRLISKKTSQVTMKSPCMHLVGESKFSLTDLDRCITQKYHINGMYIYCCTDSAHEITHSQRRRDIFLVEAFYNLRERCFITLKNGSTKKDINDACIPISLRNDYIQFLETQEKIDKCNG